MNYRTRRSLKAKSPLSIVAAIMLLVLGTIASLPSYASESHITSASMVGQELRVSDKLSPVEVNRPSYTVTEAPKPVRPQATSDPTGAQAIAAGMMGAYGWGQSEFDCLVSLWNRESGWNANAYNAASGAGGIPQALPASKMSSAGADWATNPATQITWGLGYISGRYGTPCAAWEHSESSGWY